MSAATDFVATFPDGRRCIYARVGNAASFRKAMSAVGAIVTSAGPEDFKTAGFQDGGDKIRSVASLQVVAMPDKKPSPYLSGHPKAEAAKPATAIQPAKPLRVDMAADMRKRFGLQTEEDKAAEEANLSPLAKNMLATLARQAGGW